MSTPHTIVRNPWHAPINQCSPREFVYRAAPVFTYRGVNVFASHSSWDYVLGDCAITQRAGFSCKDKARRIIDNLLDEKGSDYASHEVFSHIRAHKAKN
jgi:hypothetical protein